MVTLSALQIYFTSYVIHPSAESALNQTSIKLFFSDITTNIRTISIFKLPNKQEMFRTAAVGMFKMCMHNKFYTLSASYTNFRKL